MRTSPPDAPPAGPATRRTRRAVVARSVLTAAVVVAIFAGVLPALADYAGAWELVRSTTRAQALLVAGVALANLLSYAPLWVAAMPGLTLGRAVLVDSASTAIANTVPAGFAFGVGTTAAMYHSFGFGPGAITRGVALTGVWNNLVKLAMPAVALLGLAVAGGVHPGLGLVALAGGGLLLLGVAVLLLGIGSARAAGALAATAQRLAGRAARVLHRRPPEGWAVATDGFREHSRALVRARWPQLTAAAVASHAVLFLLLLACLRTVGGPDAGPSWPVVLAVFSITRLVTMVPITPGAIGVAELSYVAGLTAAGLDATTAAGAVLLFRFLTWFLPIPLGVVAWVLWRRGVGRPPATVPGPTR